MFDKKAKIWVVVILLLGLTAETSWSASSQNKPMTVAAVFDFVCIDGATHPNRLGDLVKDLPVKKLLKKEYTPLLFGNSDTNETFYDISGGRDGSTILGIIQYSDGSINCVVDFRSKKEDASKLWLNLYQEKYSDHGKNKLQIDHGLPLYFVQQFGAPIVMVQIGGNGNYIYFYTYYRPNIEKIQQSSDLTASSGVPQSSSSSNKLVIPMKKENGVYVVPVKINSQFELKFIVDSGAADVAVPSDVVSTLIRTGTIASTDFTGAQTYVLADGTKVPSTTFVLKSLEVGGVVVNNITASVSSSSGSLLLGQSFLEKFKHWSIDNNNHDLIVDLDGILKRDGSGKNLETSGEKGANRLVQPTLPVLEIESGWSVMKDAETNGPYKLFRKYMFDKDGFKNVIIFNCSKKEGHPFSNLTVVFPPTIEIKSFPRMSWEPKIDVRVLIGDKSSVSMLGEYRDGELYIDMTPNGRNYFKSMLEGNTIAFAFGEKNDVISFILTEKMDNFIADPATIKLLPEIERFSHYSRSEALNICKTFQESNIK